MAENSDTIASFPKNSQEEYRFSITTFKGHEYADLRIFYEKDGEYLPSKKGITIALDAWSQFREAIQKLEEALVERHLLKPGEQEE